MDLKTGIILFCAALVIVCAYIAYRYFVKKAPEEQPEEPPQEDFVDAEVVSNENTNTEEPKNE